MTSSENSPLTFEDGLIAILDAGLEFGYTMKIAEGWFTTVRKRTNGATHQSHATGPTVYASMIAAIASDRAFAERPKYVYVPSPSLADLEITL